MSLLSIITAYSSAALFLATMIPDLGQEFSLALGPPEPAAGRTAPTTRLGPLAERPRGGGKVTLHLKQPTVRIGLAGDGRTLALDSEGGVYIVDRDSGKEVWKHLYKGELHVVLEKGGVPQPPPIYLVQVASLASLPEAEELKARLEVDTGEVVTVTRYPDRNAWRVRVGQRASREEIRQVEEKLRGLGFSEIWVVQEAAPGGRQPRMRLVDEDYHDMLTTSKALLVLPAAEGRPVKVAGQPYRGVVEVVLTGSRELQTVNVLNLEDYLKGVVPRELGPTIYPELEALKSQAVAARTYVQANGKQFSEDGYDICDTARCQVYGGIAAEHPLSDFAVEQTAGEILTYEGKPINAMYTATCGGHTEDVKNVFPEMDQPYLKGVSCYADEEALVAARRTLMGVWSGPPVTLADGERVDDAVALLEALGVLTPAQTDAAFLAGFAPASDVGEWTRRTLQAVGKKAPSGVELTREVRDVAALAEHLVEAFAWGDRLRLLMSDDDLPEFLGEARLAATPAHARAALAYLVKEEILPPLRSASAPGTADPVSRALLVRALHRLVLRYEAADLRAAKYRGSRGDSIGLQAEGDLAFFRLAPRTHLVLKDDGAGVPVDRYTLHDGDNVEYHLAADGTVNYLAMKPNQRGSADDRFSSLYLWEVRTPRADLEDRIRNRASIGTLLDLLPGRRGSSGRLIDLTVVGTAGRFRFAGFNIERLLGLRETLCVVDRQYGAGGKVETFIFSGKGWGHGVGMCQVGAYGMALRGKSYSEILGHYYAGTTLQKIGAPQPPR